MGEVADNQQSVIASIPNGGKGVDLSQSDLNSVTPEGYVDPYKGLATPQDIEKYNATAYEEPVYGIETMYPGMNIPIAVGGGSNQTLGSYTNYAAGAQLFPFDVLNKKQAALQRAADIRQQRLRAASMPDVPRLKNQRYQANLDKDFMDVTEKYIQEAKSLYGDNWQTALRDPNVQTDVGRRYKQALSNFDILKSNTDEITDLASKVQADKEAGEAVYSQETDILSQEIINATDRFSKGEAEDLQGTLNQLRGSVALDEYLHKNIFPALKAQVDKRSSEYETEGGDKIKKYSELNSSINKQADAIAEELVTKGVYRNNPAGITKEDIKRRIIAQIGTQREVESSTKASPSAIKKIGSEGSGYSEDDVSQRAEKLSAISNVLKTTPTVEYKVDPETGLITEERSQMKPEQMKADPRAEAALSTLRGAKYSNGIVDKASYIFEKQKDGSIKPYLLIDFQEPLSPNSRKIPQKKIDLSDPKNEGEIAVIFNGSPAERKIPFDAVSGVMEKIKQSQGTKFVGEEKVKTEKLSLSEINKRGGQSYIEKKKKEGIRVLIDKSQEVKKQSGKKYTDVQEKAIQRAIKDNPGVSRQEIITALGLDK